MTEKKEVVIKEIQANDTAVFETFDKMDDEQVLAEIKGNFLQEFIYSFTDSKGNKITGLSLIGVNETVRELNRRNLASIAESETPPVIVETDDYIQISIYAKDTLNGGGAWGIKRQPKTQGKYNTVNPFALEQALSKAQRNAKRKLIPEKLMQEFVLLYEKKGNVKIITGKDIIEAEIITPKAITKTEPVKPEIAEDDIRSEYPEWVFNKDKGVYFPPEVIKVIFRLGYKLYDATTRAEKDKYKPLLVEKMANIVGRTVKSTKEYTYTDISKIKKAFEEELNIAETLNELNKVTKES
jgi:hypothetical protein